MSLLRYPPQETYDDLDSKINGLTDQPTLYETYDAVGVIGHARGGQVELGTAVQRISNPPTTDSIKPTVRNVSQIEIYADRLTALTSVQLPSNCDSLTLVARVAFTEPKPVVFKLPDSSKQLLIELYCSQPALPITFNFQVPNRETLIKLVADPKEARSGHRYWGISVEPDGNSSVTSFTDAKTLADFFANSTRSIVDMIQDGGKLADMGWDTYNDNLRRLLNYQLLLASKVEDVDRKLSYQIAEFIMHICQGIPKSFDLYSQASIIAASKVIEQGAAMTSLVPKLDLSTAHQVLRSRLDSAVAFDSAYRELQGQDVNSKNATLFANIALDKSIDSDRVYSFMTVTAQKRLGDAQNSFHRANKEFQALQQTLKEKQETFKSGIEAWKTKQTWKAVGEVFKGIAAVAGAIALAVAAPPAGAEALGAGAAELGTAIKETQDAVGLWQEIKGFVEAINKIYEKIEPYLKKVQELVESVSKIIDLIKSKASMDDIGNSDMAKLKLPGITGEDVTNSTADWDIFQLQMNNLYEGIKSQNIGGANEFFLTISKMVVRGKAVLAGQMALSSASDAYLTIMQQSIAQKRHTDRLRHAIPQIQGNQLAFKIIKLAFAERLLALRNWIVLDFGQYAASYAWNSLDTTPPITMDPMKDLGSFLNDAATLQALSAQVYSNVRAQTRVFNLSSGTAGINGTNSASHGNGNGLKDISLAASGSIATLDLPNDFIDLLKSTRSTTFTIDCESPMFQYYGRLRLSKARIFLDTSTGSDTTPVSLRVTLGASMKDLSMEKRETSVTGPGSATAPRVLHFVTTESTFGFEYAGNDREILLDGAFCGFRDSSSLLLSPFRTWTVTVNSTTSLETVTGIALELTCEVTYL
ncbi:hypothetical protein ACKLNR_014237 [Fusarium oxysporum f. sp. zingiberi]